MDFAVEPGYPSAAEPTVEVTLLAGYPKQDKLEQIIKHGVELALPHRTLLQPLLRGCTQKGGAEERALQPHCAGSRQAVRPGRSAGRSPAAANFGAVCCSFDQYDLVLFCYECGGAPLRQLLAEAKPANGQKLRLAIVTGAEGGFAAEEAEMAAKAGAKTVGLGPRILRCETAPLAVLSAVMT
mgnify:CR=1 FL=1